MHRNPCAAGCGQPAIAALCGDCTGQLVADLRELAGQLLGELDLVLSRQTAFGASAGVRSRAAQRPLPLNLAASELRWAVDNTLGTWAREVAETADEPPDWTSTAEAARWLAARETTLAAHPAAEEMHDEITHIAARVRTAIDRPPERRYLGACDGDGADEPAGSPPCGETLYAPPSGSFARCETCGRTYEAARRRELLLERIGDHLGTATEIAGWLALLGLSVPDATIRSWARRGRIVRRGTSPVHRRPRYRVDDVIAAAAQRSAALTA